MDGLYPHFALSVEVGGISVAVVGQNRKYLALHLIRKIARTYNRRRGRNPDLNAELSEKFSHALDGVLPPDRDYSVEYRRVHYGRQKIRAYTLNEVRRSVAFRPATIAATSGNCLKISGAVVS